MKVIAINGSPRKDGNTAAALKIMSEELEKAGIDVEIIHIGGESIRGCRGCFYCMSSENNHCAIKEDSVNEVALKMRGADGMILASPTYYAGISGTMKCFLDRVFFTSSEYFKYKVGTSLTAVRRAGGVDVTHQLNNFLNLAEIIMPPSQYWTVVYGSGKEEILKDAEGVQTLRKNARAMAWLLKAVAAGKETIPLPEDESRVMMNFIR
ncbi:MAG: flavodoxin family protein [Methanosarcinales archaeon]|jgi:multimeric flavodoxin WrbA|nr:flavodoxin family protein [Methanosarcinales archaeon]